MTQRKTLKCLQDGLKELKLPTIRSSCQAVATQARAESLSYEQFLLTLVDQERDVRRQGRIERALRASHLPLEKTLEAFDRQRLPRKVDAHVNVLLEGAFLDQCENVLAFGQPGSGKTHLLCAIGLELIYAERRVLFRRCDVLVQELLAAKRDLVLPKLLKQWSRFDLILIDDIGYVQHSRDEMEVLFLVQPQAQHRQILGHGSLDLVQPRRVIVEHSEVIGVAQVAAAPEPFLHEMVEAVQIEVGEELGCQVPDGDTVASFQGREEIVPGEEDRWFWVPRA